ncbi:MAG TPA: glycosyltransferase [Acidimicrobiales bacterium]|nr:glycosyltransferase [Acidimicrobiales bacterium]
MSGARATVLVATTGGHLAQLYEIAPRITGVGERIWITNSTLQSRSLLADEHVQFVDAIEPGDWRAIVRALPSARRLFGSGRWQQVVSTGAALAIPYLSAAASHGIETHYIESAARVSGPSRTGQIMRRLPRVRVYSQYDHWARPPWRFVGSIFDAYAPTPTARVDPIRRAVVALGTLGPKYPFRRLLERLVPLLGPAGDLERMQGSAIETVWQTGFTNVDGLGIEARPMIEAAELDCLLRGADLVVSHAGVGSALGALQAERCPVLVARLRSFGENVDDHQQEIARALSERGVALSRTVAELSIADLLQAADTRVVRSTSVASVELAR